MHLSDFQEFAQKYKTSTHDWPLRGNISHPSKMITSRMDRETKKKSKLNLGDKNIQNQTPKSYNRVLNDHERQSSREVK